MFFQGYWLEILSILLCSEIKQLYGCEATHLRVVNRFKMTVTVLFNLGRARPFKSATFQGHTWHPTHYRLHCRSPTHFATVFTLYLLRCRRSLKPDTWGSRQLQAVSGASLSGRPACESRPPVEEELHPQGSVGGWCWGRGVNMTQGWRLTLMVRCAAPLVTDVMCCSSFFKLSCHWRAWKCVTGSIGRNSTMEGCTEIHHRVWEFCRNKPSPCTSLSNVYREFGFRESRKLITDGQSWRVSRLKGLTCWSSGPQQSDRYTLTCGPQINKTKQLRPQTADLQQFLKPSDDFKPCASLQ